MLQGFHGNKTTNNITERIRRRRRLIYCLIDWRHSDVIIINPSAFILNEIPYKTYISDFLYMENNRIYADLP